MTVTFRTDKWDPTMSIEALGDPGYIRIEALGDPGYIRMVVIVTFCIMASFL